MDPTNLPKRTTPHWSLYQRHAFDTGGALFSSHPAEIERLAHERLSAGGWSYASCNAGLGDTHAANRAAFQHWRIVPRMLVDTNARDTTTHVYGQRLAAPLAFSPVGINKIYHPDGELPVARVAGELGLPYSLSTAGSCSIEDAAAHNDQGAQLGKEQDAGSIDSKGLRYFQLYLPHDDELATSLLQRAADAGYDACIFTVDTWQLGWRHEDIRLGNYGFYRGIGTELGASDPVFRRKLDKWGLDPVKDSKEVGRKWIDSVWHGKAFDWAKLPWVIAEWKRVSGGKPFLLKGVQSVGDALRAKEAGCDGAVVSNHAGRQVDGAVGSLDVLPEIREAVGADWTLMFDSGVRSGADIFKAIALGADVVMIGRMWIYGLSIKGEEGVRHVLRSLLAEFDILMNVAGFRSIKEIDRSALRYVGPAGAHL